ncbi:hypothetical protein [Spirosoma agri]|uniref:Uncharacterized protein n=1 Tax=Spirosoma agri TaxID=1987381 RepID=A0A6M0II51_9BACT|nr:hypothetical protein [Spirosoma agri]NEU67940.1 hypothetical protein [Spirosoma agri]
MPESWAEVSLGQFLTLSDPQAPKDSLFIISTLSGLSIDELRGAVAYDLDEVVLSHLAFIWTAPAISSTPPEFLTINDQRVGFPDDLGTEVTLGQMVDVRHVIRGRQSKKEPVEPVVMASTVLPVFLWGKMRTDKYVNRQKATEQLWESIQTISCLDGLAASAFFLRNSLKLSPSGRVSVQAWTNPTSLKGWLLRLRQSWKSSTISTPQLD